jgi:putative holliday junction resolvase
LRRGRRLAIDVGKARIGLATCDADGILSWPLEAIARNEGAISEIGNLIQADEIVEVYVGLPISLSGMSTNSTEDAIEFARELADLSGTSLRMIDERLTTVQASGKLRESGKSSKSSKSLIDSASAVEILEQALSMEKSSGEIPGIGLDS